MFDKKINPADNSELTPLESQNTLATDLPTSNQPEVTPKFNSTNISGLGAQDMFAETEENEPALADEPPAVQNIQAPVSRPANSSVGPTEPLAELPNDMDYEPDNKKKYIWFGAIVLGILVLGGGYFAYSKFLSGSMAVPNIDINISPADFNKQLQEEVVNLNLNQDVPDNIDENMDVPNEDIPDFPSIPNDDVDLTNNPDEEIGIDNSLDSDKDGLTDAEEELLGTDSNSTDTDGDGLFDYEEAKTYNTNPLNPDTDGDGFLDGQEVKGGYNPNGPGKLLEANFN